MNVPLDPLLISVAAPLAVAVAIALGLPKRWAVKLAYAGFAVPALVAIDVWSVSYTHLDVYKRQSSG